MAKVKSDTTTAPEVTDATFQGDDTTQSAATPQPQADPAPATEQTTETTTKTEAKSEPAADAVAQEPDAFTQGILKLHSSQSQLYIDKQGGVFRTGTPERIRGGAILYTNPYFKSN